MQYIFEVIFGPPCTYPNPIPKNAVDCYTFYLINCAWLACTPCNQQLYRRQRGSKNNIFWREYLRIDFFCTDRDESFDIFKQHRIPKHGIQHSNERKYTYFSCKTLFVNQNLYQSMFVYFYRCWSRSLVSILLD